jgi:site-specific DNA recombinase
LERAVQHAIAALLSDWLRLARELGLYSLSADCLKKVLATAQELAALLNQAPQPNASLILLIDRVNLHAGHLEIALSSTGLLALLGLSARSNIGSVLHLTHPLLIQRRGVETKIMLASHPYPPSRDEHLIRILARSYKWMQQLIAGEVVSLKALAADEGLDPAEISRHLPLACLSPDIIEAIVAGREPTDLTVERLKRLPELPFQWSKQHQLLGCPSDAGNVNRPKSVPVRAPES